MKVLICFKVVPDMDMMGDWNVGAAGTIDFSPLRKLWNCFDEGSLELFLKLRDAGENGDDPLRLDVLTVGGAYCDTYLKTLAALGFDSMIRIARDDSCSPELTARIVAAFVRYRSSYDFIVMGAQSPERNSGVTPFLTAEYLGWMCISHCLSIAVSASGPRGAVTVHSHSDAGELVQTIRPPCVFTVGNSADAYLRTPTLKERLTRGAKSLEVYTPERFGIDTVQENVEMHDMKAVNHTRQGILIDEGTVADRVARFYTGYLMERLEKR